ncbi:MAG: hypothetical protein EBX52_12995 [Proteobacteria bacterium]|nr:hypothetical protein [Pseudomonadota bacterium]
MHQVRFPGAGIARIEQILLGFVVSRELPGFEELEFVLAQRAEKSLGSTRALLAGMVGGTHVSLPFRP